MKSNRKLRRRVDEAFAKLLGRADGKVKELGTAKRPAANSLVAPIGPDKSKKEVSYQPHRAPGVKFRDTRGGTVEVSERGELRAVDKPRSRVKRLREEAKNRKTKETGPSGNVPK